MDLSLVPVLTVFVLLALSGGAYFVAKKSGVPHTVVLVVLGVCLIPLAHVPGFAFLDTFRLTPELLFYIFLPTLIFESAFNLNIRRLTADAIPVAVLSIVSLLVSALAVALGLWVILPFFGLPIPFPILFIFGALISATDPVAVLALFKEYGAPRRLTMLFEGESLFNDGTGFALFLIAIEIALKGTFGFESAAEGLLSFVIMIAGGALFGLVVGGIFAKMIGYARSNESVAITLMLVLAHTTFLLSEFISAHVVIAGFPVHLSSIIATTVAAMVIGNYGRAKLPQNAGEFIERFWGQIAFFANSIVFILIGTLAVSLPLNAPGLIIPIILVVVVVALARALSIYPIIGAWNLLSRPFEVIPRAWQHLLAWGSLRGALAVTMALLVPTDWVISTPAYTGSVHNVLLAFTAGCIFATLFIKATTIGPLMRRLGADRLNPLEQAEHDIVRTHIYADVTAHIDAFDEKGYLLEPVAKALHDRYAARFSESKIACDETCSETGLGTIGLRIWALGAEKHALGTLYRYGEITEPVYKRILGKLTIRLEHAEAGYSSSEIHLRGGGDVFEWCAEKLRKVLGTTQNWDDPKTSYMYYRALSILARKAKKELQKLKAMPDPIFSAEIIDDLLAVYEAFRAHTLEALRALEEAHPKMAAELSRSLAGQAVLKIEEHQLEHFYAREMITPKVYLGLRQELEREVQLHS